MTYSLKSKTSLVVIFFIYFASISQNLEQDSSPTITNDYTNWNGFWSGEVTYTQLGKCKYLKDSIHITKALFRLDFTDIKNLKIVELRYSKQLNRYAEHINSPLMWYGEINNQNVLSSIKSHSSICNGESRDYETYPSGKISNNKGEYVLNITSEEEWCPGMGCKFKVDYNIKYTDSIFTNIDRFDLSKKSKNTIKKPKKSLWNQSPD